MSFELPASGTISSGILGAACTLAGVITAAMVISGLSNYHKLDGIPAVGSNGWLDSWWAGRKFRFNGEELIREGYQKYKSSPFKVAERNRWWVILGGRKHIEELRNAPDDVMSHLGPANELLKWEFMVGPEMLNNPYHSNAIRGHLTPNLDNLFPEVLNELTGALDESLELYNNEWKSVPAMATMQHVICRASSRAFVGLPLCNDPDWIELNLQFALNVFDAAGKINRFGRFLAPIVVCIMTDLPGIKKRTMEHLAPLVDERLKFLQERGNDKAEISNDMLSWLIVEAPEGIERTLERLTNRILSINFSAVHTSSSTFVRALFFLADNPQYVQPLREEVEHIVKTEGWSKASLAKMYKIDSFMKESLRLFVPGSVSMGRLTLKDFTFSDGTFIPRGTMVAVPAGPLHLDEEKYENAHQFNPFRFSDMRDREGDEAKFRFASTGADYLSFGHGNHACSGRFFAAMELKSLLAHIVMMYDVKLDGDKPSPDKEPFAQIMFRRRAN